MFVIHHVQTGSGAHPSSCPMGTGAFSLGVKRPGCEADHLPPSSAEVRECVVLYLHSPNTSSWHRDNFTFSRTSPVEESISIIDLRWNIAAV
jgi:hypothetical protein